MFARWSIVSFLVLFAFSLGNASFAEEGTATKGKKNRKKSEAPIIDVSPMGEPPGKLPGLRVWCDKEGWHLRYRAKEHGCKGIIRVVGGTVVKIYDFNGMEVAKKKPRKGDLGQLSPDKKAIAFKLYSFGKEDGFSFQVTGNAQKLIFDVQEDGYYHPKRIHIGAKGIPPSKGVFELPAQPKNPSESAKK
jgi:hypothetical protein